MSLSIRLQAEPVKSIGFAAIGAGYMSVGIPLQNAASFILFQNLTDVPLMISFNGIDDNFPLQGAGGLILDVTSNKSIINGFFVAQDTQFYVKQLGAAPSAGSFYISSFYGDEA